VGVLKEWLKKLGASDKRVVLIKPAKKPALVLSSIVCRNMNTIGEEVSVYDQYLRISMYLGNCGCEYSEIDNGCRATIRIVRSLQPRNVCKHNRLIITGVSSGWYNREDSYILRFTQTSKPGRYILEINSAKYLVELDICSLSPAALSAEEEMILNTLYRELEARRYLSLEELLSIISRTYDINKSMARIKLNEIIAKGLAIPVSKNTIEIPFLE
jgi:hypothetical protein